MKIPFYLLRIERLDLINIELKVTQQNLFLKNLWDQLNKWDELKLSETKELPEKKKWISNYFNLEYIPSTSEMTLYFSEHFLLNITIPINLADSIFSPKISSFPFFYYAILKNPIKKIIIPRNTRNLYIYLQIYKKSINKTKADKSRLYFKTYFIGEPFIKFDIKPEEFQTDLQQFEEILRKDIKKFEEIVKFFGRR